MTIVISPERAVADGISPQELLAVAVWHQERAALIHRSMVQASAKRKPMGTAADASRHERMARALNGVASHLRKPAQSRAVA
jgi:hypothetical protein